MIAGRMLTGHLGRAGELLFPQSDHIASKFSLRELGLDRLLVAGRVIDRLLAAAGSRPTS